MSSKVYFVGVNAFDFLIDKKTLQLREWSPIDGLQNVKKIITAGRIYSPLVLILKSSGELELINESFTHKYPSTKEEIKDIISGHFTFLILTESGKVFSLAKYGTLCGLCSNKEIPITDLDSDFDTLRPVDYFLENNLKVKDIKMGSRTNYYLCEGGDLYGSGLGISGN